MHLWKCYNPETPFKIKRISHFHFNSTVLLVYLDSIKKKKMKQILLILLVEIKVFNV